MLSETCLIISLKQTFGWHQLRKGTYMAVASYLLISWFRGESIKKSYGQLLCFFMVNNA